MILFVLIVVLRPMSDVISFSVGMFLLLAWAPHSLDAWLVTNRKSLAGKAALVAFVYGFLHPILGVQMMASSKMYGNVKNFGGTGNHMVVSTG